MTAKNPDADLIEWAAEQTWSSFATDVASKAVYYGLTERQRAALVSMRAKVEANARPAQKPAQTASPAPIKGFGEVIEFLDHIDASGNKWPKVFLSLKDSPEDDEERRIKVYRYQHGDNMGSAGFKLEDIWLGNIDRATGAWSPTPKASKLDSDTKAKVWRVLNSLRTNARDTFAINGKNVGTCACCGKALSNDESVQRGIGPECWSKLGMA